MQKEIKPINGGLARTLLYFLTGKKRYSEDLPKDKKRSIIKGNKITTLDK